jgi:hypothetical protein
VTVAFGVPVKVNVALLLAQMVVGLTATLAVGSGNIVMVTVEVSGTHKAEETVYVKVYGLPASVIDETSKVPRCPLAVVIGPDQTPSLSGVPPNKPNKLKGAVVETWSTQTLLFPSFPASFKS